MLLRFVFLRVLEILVFRVNGGGMSDDARVFMGLFVERPDAKGGGGA